jgi:hypothetical protein
MNKHVIRKHKFIHRPTLFEPWFEDELWDNGVDPHTVIKYNVHYDMNNGQFPIDVAYINDMDEVICRTITIPTRIMFQYD